MAMYVDESFGRPLPKGGSRVIDEVDGNPIEDQPNVYVTSPGDGLDEIETGVHRKFLGKLYKELEMAKYEDGGLAVQLLKGLSREIDEVGGKLIEDQPNVYVTSPGDGLKTIETGVHRKFLVYAAGKSPHVNVPPIIPYRPFEASEKSPPMGYIEAKGAAADKAGGTNGLQELRNIGMDQGALVVLMFAACYLLYMLLKKRVCSLNCGWKDTGGGDLELGRLRDE